MAVVPITINCIVYPKDKSGDPYPATIVGNAWLSGLEAGQPLPPAGTEPPVEPGFPGHPMFPIWGPPGMQLPGGPGYPPVAGQPLPTPEPPPEIPTTPSDPKPPPANGGWGWSPTYGWGYFPPPGSARPKR